MCIKKQRHHFADKGVYNWSYGFSSSHVWMWELDPKEGWVLKNGCFWIVVREKTLESPLHSKIKPVNPKGNQPRKDSCWSYSSYTLATWCKEPTHWKRFWCWERLRAGEAGDKGWDGWMASLTQWTWIWANWERVDRGVWHDAIRSIARTWTRLSDWTTTNQ